MCSYYAERCVSSSSVVFAVNKSQLVCALGVSVQFINIMQIMQFEPDVVRAPAQAYICMSIKSFVSTSGPHSTRFDKVSCDGWWRELHLLLLLHTKTAEASSFCINRNMT